MEFIKGKPQIPENKGIEYSRCYEDVRKMLLLNRQAYMQKMKDSVKDEDYEWANKHKNTVSCLLGIICQMDVDFSYSSNKT